MLEEVDSHDLGTRLPLDRRSDLKHTIYSETNALRYKDSGRLGRELSSRSPFLSNGIEYVFGVFFFAFSNCFFLDRASSTGTKPPPINYSTRPRAGPPADGTSASRPSVCDILTTDHPSRDTDNRNLA